MARPPNTEILIDIIEDIRAQNNKLWMDILRIAMALDPETTREITKEISKNDRKITKCLGKL